MNALAPVLGMTPVALAAIPLPLGISFFTFHAISYVVDVYKRNAQRRAQPAALRALHPAVSAAHRRPDHPLARHRRAARAAREQRIADFAYGVRRFVLGLGKKVLIANTLGRAADAIFALPAAELTTPLAWLGLACYTLQIYFDFSGYSDMAIGLMRMFGFRILENFNYPYIARSIREFWRRWHISLSNWFRDYLYIPLGGNQRGDRARLRQSRDRVPAVRAVARRELAVRAVGHVARRCSSSPSAPASIACCARIGPLAHVYALARGDGRLGALPLRHARPTRSSTIAALLGIARGRSGARIPSRNTSIRLIAFTLLVGVVSRRRSRAASANGATRGRGARGSAGRSS